METDENENKENLTNGNGTTVSAEGGEGKKEGKSQQQTSDVQQYKKVARASAVPECEMYCYLLAIMKLLDTEKYEKARTLSTMAVDRLGSFNR